MSESVLTDAVAICDVAPRDGLQNEPRYLSAPVRAELCDRIAAAGVRRIEAVSFVNPVRVPQMAGAEEVMAAIRQRAGVSVSGLVLNLRGVERALQAGVDEIQYAFPVTDAFAQRNQGTTVAAAVATAAEIVARARAAGVRVSVTLSAAFGCPFEGRVSAAHVLKIAEAVVASGPDELMLADTIGVGVPTQVTELVRGGADLGVPLGCHFHNTRNTGFANSLAALETGVRRFDAATGGTGGCPFAPGAAGNIATEDLVYMLDGMGVQTGISLEGLLDTGAWLAGQLQRELPGMTLRAGPFPAPG